MGNPESLAADRFEVVAFQLGAWGKGDGMNNNVQVVPVVVEVIEYRIDLLVIGMRTVQEIDQNIRTMAGDTTLTDRDRSLLKGFAAKVMKSDGIKKMKVE